MKTLFDEANIYISLWCLYWTQGFLFESGGTLSQALLLIVLLLSLRYSIRFCKSIVSNKFFKAYNFLFGCLLLYGFIYMFSGNDYVIQANGSTIQAFGYVKQILCSFTPLYASYFLSSKGQITYKTLKCWSFIFLIVSFLVYYKEYQSAQLLAIVNGSNRTEFVNNSAYIFVSLFPLILLWKENKSVQCILLTVILVSIVICMKRGALLCSIPCIYIILRYIFKTAKNKEKLIYFILAVGILIVILHFIEYMQQHSDLFIDRMLDTKEGKTSRRDEIYSGLLIHAFDRNLIYWIIGEGANATLLHGENFAHNDWLELLIDNGFIGISIYTLYWIRFNKVRKSIVNTRIEYFALSMYFCVFFMKTFFSMSYSSWHVFATIPLGCFLFNAFNEEKYESEIC